MVENLHFGNYDEPFPPTTPSGHLPRKQGRKIQSNCFHMRWPPPSRGRIKNLLRQISGTFQQQIIYLYPVGKIFDAHALVQAVNA